MTRLIPACGKGEPATAVGVLTFHTCINYGSYWQARCLVEGLRARGHNAVLLDHRSRGAASAELRSAFQPELPLRTPRQDHPALARKVRAFAKETAKLPLSRPFPLDRPEEAGTYRTVVVGSDEVWNFSHPWYSAKPIFFGNALRTERLVSYAASFGNHLADNGLDAYWAAQLRRFDAISVRDENSRAMVGRALAREPVIVLDPCLQFPEALPAAAEADTPYALLYGHGLPDWFGRAVRRWADSAGLRLVSAGYRSPYAEQQEIDAGPLDFPRLVSGARAVATNFFHGAVFALHYGKPFIAAASPYRRIKLESLTNGLGAARHMVTEQTSDEEIRLLMEVPLDPAIGDRIIAARDHSTKFLDHALG